MARKLLQTRGSRRDALLEPELVLGAIRRAQDGLTDEDGQFRIMPLDRAEHPAQEGQLLLGDRLAALDAALDRVIRLGQRRIVLKGTDAPGQAEQIVDLDRVKLHGRGGGEPEGAGARSQGLLERPVEIPVSRLHHQSGRRVAAAGIVGLVHQGDIPGLPGQFLLTLLAPNQAGGDDHAGGAEHRLGRELLLQRMLVEVPDLRT